jgi:hypothetical protein
MAVMRQSIHGLIKSCAEYCNRGGGYHGSMCSASLDELLSNIIMVVSGDVTLTEFSRYYCLECRDSTGRIIDEALDKYKDGDDPKIAGCFSQSTMSRDDMLRAIVGLLIEIDRRDQAEGGVLVDEGKVEG